jgi:hypothetical protein
LRNFRVIFRVILRTAIKVRFLEPAFRLAFEAGGLTVETRAARWHILNPKIPIWVNFVGSSIGRCWYILRPFDLFYGNLYILWPLDILVGYLVYFSQEKSGNPGRNGTGFRGISNAILRRRQKPPPVAD